MRAGLLKEEIDIIQNQFVKNKFGEETEEWVIKYHTRARLIHNGGQRTLQNNEIFYTDIKTLEIRYYVPIGNFNRIIWNGETFRIVDIEDVKEQNKKIVKIEKINE